MLKHSTLILVFTLITLILPGCTSLPPDAGTANLPPQINAFSASPESITQGQSALLTWDVSDADSVVITPDIGNKAVSGEVQVNPALTTSYTIIATNDYGTSKSTLTLSVAENTPSSLANSPVIVAFKAEPATIWAGAAVTVSWEVMNATSISLEWGDGDPLTIREASGSMVFRPVIPTAYQLMAVNTSKSFTSGAWVTIKEDVDLYSVEIPKAGSGGG